MDKCINVIKSKRRSEISVEPTETLETYLAKTVRHEHRRFIVHSLIESLTKNEATSFCIAVETKEKKGEIFGALMVFPEREGLKLNKTEWQGTSESYLFTFPQKQANVKRQPKKFLASANTDGHYCWCCRDMVASNAFPTG